jgi:spermidine/putrescine transport system substrate-binding protein
MPGLDGLLPFFKQPPFTTADGHYHGIPWTWGFTGLTYRSDRADAPQSWEDLLQPSLKGKVSTIDGALNNVALASLAVGIDPDELTTSQLEGDVTDYLQRLLGQMRTLAPSIGDQISLLVSGDVDYMVAGLKFMDAETAGKGVQTQTIVPQEGAIGWADTTFVTASAPHPANALAYGAHLLEPSVNAAANSELLQGPGVQSAIPKLTPEAKKQYPYDDLDHYLSEELTFNRGFPHEPDGDRATYQQVLDLWQRLKTEM